MSTPDLDERRSSPEAEERLKEEGAAQLNATLFVANVDKQATEDEISTVFSRFMRERERERGAWGGGGGGREGEREGERERERTTE